MKLLYKILRQKPDTREGIITATSVFGILCNALIAALRIVVGLWASSIAIITEGVNNAADALTSFLTMLGTKLSAKHPDEKQPFGYGRIEYLTSLAISILILYSGIEMLTHAIEFIINGQNSLDISYVTMAIVAGSALVKFFLGVYTIKTGQKAESKALEAVGLECRNDAFVSVITLISAAVFLLFGLPLDAYAGIITSLLILKTGFGIFKDTISELLGRPGKKELAKQLYQKIRRTDGILGAADLMLHNYGPDSYSGSVNLEIDHKKPLGEIYHRIHKLQLEIMEEYHVTLVFGLYAVDNDSAESKALRKTIADYIVTQNQVKSFHALYLDPENQKCYCDFIVDYRLKDWETLRADFEGYMREIYPNYEIILTIETEFV